MKILITYYSYSGITAKVINIFKEALQEKGEVEIQRLKPKQELTSFISQCMAARSGKRCELEGSVLFNVSAYDIIIVGLPVWAFAPVPAINTYLDNISGLAGKKAITLITSGSGVGVNTCFRTLRNILKDKGAIDIKEINIPNAKMVETDFIVSAIEKAV
jgi:multimeric flavodoxin WrbA